MKHAQLSPNLCVFVSVYVCVYVYVCVCASVFVRMCVTWAQIFKQQLRKPRENNGGSRILWWIGSVAKLRVQIIDKLDGAHTKAWGELSDDACVATQLRLRHTMMGWRGFWRFLGQSSNCRMDRNGLHGEGVTAPSHGRACAGVCACLQWAWCALNKCPGH